MYNPNYMYRPRIQRYNPNLNNRFIGGGFVAPFLLGGLTGGLLAPAFYPKPYYPRPYYYQPYPPYQQTPIYYQ